MDDVCEIFTKMRKDREEEVRSVGCHGLRVDESDAEDIVDVGFSYESFRAKNNDKNMIAMTGLSYEYFGQLHDILYPYIQNQKRGRKRLDTKTQLFIFLIWVTTGLSYSKLAVHLGIARSLIDRSVANIIGKSGPVLQERYLPRNISQVPRGARFRMSPEAIGAIDATPIFIQRPTDQETQRSVYSGKYKRHCMKIQCLVSPDGLCIHYAGAYRGAKHDSKIFRDSRVAEFAKNSKDGIKPILADSGYQGCQDVYPELVIPYKKRPGGQLSEDQKNFNHDLSRDRIIVENFFGRMKTLFGVLKVFRGTTEQLQILLPIIVCLTNFYIERHPRRLLSYDRIEGKDHQSDDEDSADAQDPEMVQQHHPTPEDSLSQRFIISKRPHEIGENPEFNGETERPEDYLSQYTLDEFYIFLDTDHRDLGRCPIYDGPDIFPEEA